MPVVIDLGNGGGGGGGGGGDIFTTTVQDIIECVQQNLKDRFTQAGSTSVLIDYINNVHQQILRQRRWDWTLSEPQKFLTERGQSDYWIGATGSQPTGVVDTGLNLDDVQYVANVGVRNRSQFTPLISVKTPPEFPGWQLEDSTYSEGDPAQFRTTLAQAGLLSLYPAPNEGSEYAIVPAAPHATVATSGALSARTYYIRLTFVDEAGNESLPSTTSRHYIGANEALTVVAPRVPISASATGVAYASYNVYASTTQGSETLQNVSPTTIGTNWTEAGSGLTTSGATVPTTATIEPLRGHLIEFQYHFKHVNLTATTDILMVPDEYADVVCAGATAMAAQWKANESEGGGWQRVDYWSRQYENGIRRMIQNDNIGPGAVRYILPDPAWRTPSWL